MRLLVCGSRTWTDADAIRARLRMFPPGTVVVTGGARGADLLAQKAAREFGFGQQVYLADWSKGRQAGIVRNLRMLDTEPDEVLAFQQHGSRGTQHTIDEARRRGIPVEVIDA